MNLTVNSSVNPMDISKINTVFPGNGAMGMDPDRQWLHVTNSVRYTAFTGINLLLPESSPPLFMCFVFCSRNADFAIG